MHDIDEYVQAQLILAVCDVSRVDLLGIEYYYAYVETGRDIHCKDISRKRYDFTLFSTENAFH